MSRLLKVLAMGGALLALGTAAHAEGGVVRWHDMSMDMAKAVAEATLNECRSKGYNTAAVVVDRSGAVLVMLRHEQATPQTAELARRKAYTARVFRRTTLDWAQRMRDDPSYEPQRDLDDVIALGGGVPVVYGEEVIGAVASAGSTQPQDDACAKVGVAKAISLMQ